MVCKIHQVPANSKLSKLAQYGRIFQLWSISQHLICLSDPMGFLQLCYACLSWSWSSVALMVKQSNRGITRRHLTSWMVEMRLFTLQLNKCFFQMHFCIGVHNTKRQVQKALRHLFWFRRHVNLGGIYRFITDSSIPKTTGKNNNYYDEGSR